MGVRLTEKSRSPRFYCPDCSCASVLEDGATFIEIKERSRTTFDLGEDQERNGLSSELRVTKEN